MTTRSTHTNAFYAAVVVGLWLMFGLYLHKLDAQSLALDEGWTMWAIRDPSLLTTVERIGTDVHPPLYFLLLDGWVVLAGTSVFAARLLSVYWALIGLAGTIALGRRLFDRWTGVIALCYLGAAGFTVYYAREARMYTQMMALSVLTVTLYLRWREAPTRRRMLWYAGALSLLLYTHYFGVWIMAAQRFHALLVRLRRWQWWQPAVVALVLFVPAAVVLRYQISTHPVDHSTMRPVNYAEMYWLFLLLMGLYWTVSVVPFALGDAPQRLARRIDIAALLALWIALPPVAILAVTAWLRPSYQPRYVIGMTPALALLLAYGTRRVRWRVAAIGFVIAGVLLHLAAYPHLWPEKARWEALVQNTIAARDPNDLLIAWFDPDSIIAYYDLQLELRRGNVITLDSRSDDPRLIRELVAGLGAESPVWVVMTLNTRATWDIVGALDATHHVGQRDGISTHLGIDNLVLYRFDPGDTDDLQFRFGEDVAYHSGIGHIEYLATGEAYCPVITLRALRDLDGRLSAGLHLVDADGRLAGQDDSGLGVVVAGEAVPFAPCIMESLAPGVYYVTLVVYEWATVTNLPVIEGDVLLWGDALISGIVVIDSPPDDGTP